MLCNANPRNKKKNKKPKNNGHKGKSNETQGPCQKDSIKSSLLHPNLLDAPRALEFVFTLE